MEYDGKHPEVHYVVAKFHNRILHSSWKFCHHFQFTVLAIGYIVV